MSQIIYNLAKNGIWHQDIPFLGSPVPLSYPEQRKSKFYHLGKWNTFIEPLLPFDDFSTRDFMEIGCNAGLFLFEAHRLGFKTVYGIEADKDFYKQLEFCVKTSNAKNIRISQRHIGLPEPNVDIEGSSEMSAEDLRVVDVTLLSNLTYWLYEKDLLCLLETLSTKSLYIIVVTDNDVAQMSLGDFWYLLKCFSSHWTFLQSKIHAPEDDPTPRNMTSMLFQSKHLVERNIEEVEEDMLFGVGVNGCDNFCFYKTFSQLVCIELFGNGMSSESSAYFRFMMSRAKNRDPKKGLFTKTEILTYINMWKRYIIDIKNNGLKEPLELMQDIITKRELVDGGHRMVTLEQLGYSRVICKDKRNN